MNFDCKVVRVVEHPTYSAEVYSSNRNVWRTIEPEPIDVPCRNAFNACLHGFLLSIGDNGVIAFDLNKEVFICNIDLPTHSFDHHDCSHFDACITDFNDSIDVFNSRNEGFDGKINLWTLDDEACLHGSGAKASWSLIISLYLGNASLGVWGFFNNVEFLITVEADSSVLYNFEKKVCRDISDLPDFDEFSKYTESLFSIAGSKLVNWTA